MNNFWIVSLIGTLSCFLLSTILPIFRKRRTHHLVKPKQLPPFLSGDWNTMTKWVFKQGGFVEACIARMMIDRDNAIIIEGERGEGKTNALLFFVEYFNLHFNNPFSVYSHIYLGRDVDLTINFIANDFRSKPYSAIGIDEAEIPFSKYTAISIQNREAKIFMDTFRELKLLIFFVCPDKDILDPRIVDRCNWNIICDWNDPDRKQVEATVEYYGKSKDRTRFKWLKYEEIFIPYVDEAIYERLRRRKHGDLYTEEGITKDYKETRKQRIDKVKKDKKLELAMKIEEIKNSDLTIDKKIMELLRIEVPKYKVEAVLKKQGATKSRVELAEHYLEVEKAKQLESASKKSKKS